jgi:ribose transport system permease protein
MSTTTPGAASPSNGGAASAAAPAPSTSSVERTVRRKPLDILLDCGIYVALLALIVWFSIASPYFLTYRNLLNVGLAVSITGIMAAAITVGLIAGQLDLSIGSVLGLSAVVTALGIQIWGLPLLVAALIGLLAGLVVGVVNGFLIVNIGINSIIVTLAMALTVNGVAEMLTSGQVVSITNLTLQGIVNSRPLGVPMPFIAMVIVFALGYVLLTRTKPGWHIYAVGGNSTAALRSGIKVNRIYRNLFLLTGIAAAVAGLITAGRAGGGGPSFGQGAEFDVLTAVLLGGIGLSGGAGRIERTLVGVLIIGVLNNGLTLLSVDSYVQDTARGAVFVLAVVLGAIATKRSAR